MAAITVNTIRTMERYYNTDPTHIIAAFGPCNCGRCYEVGEEFPDLLKGSYTPRQMEKILRPAIKKRSPGDPLPVILGRTQTGVSSRLSPKKMEIKYYLDIKEAIRTDLISRVGVKEENIYDTGICCYESDLYPSYRRDGMMDLNRQILSGIILL